MESNLDIQNFSKEEASIWLRNLGLTVSGTREELLDRVKKFIRYPRLVERLQKRAENNFKFQCSLDPLTIPPITAKWRTSEKLPFVSHEIFKKYSSLKQEGSIGQQEKAARMLQSRKIVTVKTLEADPSLMYIKALIKKSYGQQSRPAVILFFDGLPQKSNCPCPVGASGLCCHVLCLLLYLKHFSETKEKIEELTCTEKLQKWHRRVTKGSIPMIPLREIKLKSAKLKRKNGEIFCSPADPHTSHFTRDVTSLKAELKAKLEKEKPVTEHFYTVMSKYECGRNSSFGQHLMYKFEKNKAHLLGDHQYLSKPLYDCSIISEDSFKLKRIEEAIDNCSTTKNISLQNNVIKNENIVSQNKIPIFVEKSTIMYNKDHICTNIENDINEQMLKDTNSILTVDLSFLSAPDPTGSNYMNVEQNTNEWHQTRKFKITGSRLPSLIGFYGKKSFTESWQTVKTGKTENNRLKGIRNIQRGHEFEETGRKYFEKVSKSSTKKCGFFHHPIRKHFGASPDALGPAGFLLEIKTRAENSNGPISSITLFPNYYAQCQLQLGCTDANFCILLSYHPESNTGKFFLIKRNDLLLDIIMDICECILFESKIIEWNHHETQELSCLGDKLFQKELSFENLKPVRQYIKKLITDVRLLEFRDDIDLEI